MVPTSHPSQIILGSFISVVLLGFTTGCSGRLGDTTSTPGPDASSTDRGSPDGGADMDAGTAPGPDAGVDGGPAHDAPPMGEPEDDASMPAVGGEVLYLLDGETGRFGDGSRDHDTGHTYALCRTHREESISFADTGPVRSGTYAVRFHLESDWYLLESPPCGFSGDKPTRATLKAPVRLAEGSQYWLGWATWVPADWVTTPSRGHAVFTLHPQPGNGPPIEIRITADGAWKMESRRGLDGPTLEFGDVTVEAWEEFVLQLVPARDDRGMFRLWHRVRGGSWEQVVEHLGPTIQPDAEPPVAPELGMIISGSGWPDPHDTRTIYFDEVRIGDAAASFDVVAPGSGARPRSESAP